MPISATGISSSRHRQRARRPSTGFTLLELLVVVTIIGVFIGVAVLSTDLVGFDRKLQQEATRLRNLLSLVQEESLLQSRDYGILFTDKNYRFFFFDHDQSAWILPADDRLLAARSLPEGMKLELELDGVDVSLEEPRQEEADKAPVPQVIVFSSGEIIPFQLDIVRDDIELGIGGVDTAETVKATLIVENDGSMEVTRGAL
ncbi:MAG: type II secretion system minor pseudopilin GspH [Gammaproteobacteria bacterium]